MLSSIPSATQDVSAYLQVLYAAVRQHGASEQLVSDGGGIFRAKQAKRVYEAFGIQKREIKRRQPWRSYIETKSVPVKRSFRRLLVPGVACILTT